MLNPAKRVRLGHPQAAIRQGQVAMLELFGVQENTERVYRAMLADPQAGVAEIALELGLSDAAVSAELDRLAELLLVEPNPSGGTRYRALAPDLAIEELISRQENLLSELQQQLTRSRSQVTAYVQSYVESRIRRDDLGMVEVIDDNTVVNSRLYQLVRTATRSCATVVPGPGLPEALLDASARLDEELLERSVSTRVLVEQGSLANDHWAAHLAQQVARGVQVRAHPAPGFSIIVVDLEKAVVPRHGSAGGLILHGRDLVAPVAALIDELWADANPIDVPTEDSREDFSEARLRQVVLLLAQGHKDESIARKLGLSVRTVRRLVSAAITALQADSRFHAGVEAVRRGWVS